MSVRSLYNYPANGSSNLKMNSCGLNSLTSTQISALTPTAGELAYNKTNNVFQGYNGSTWNVFQTTTNPSGFQNYSFFRAHTSAPQSITAAATVICDTVDDNNTNGLPGGYNSTTGMYTAPVNGVYQFNFGTAVYGTNGSVTNPQIFLLRNGSDDIAITPGGAVTITLNTTTQFEYNISGCIFLTAGDTVSVSTLAQGLSPGVNDYAISISSYFTGCLIMTTP